MTPDGGGGAGEASSTPEASRGFRPRVAGATLASRPGWEWIALGAVAVVVALQRFASLGASPVAPDEAYYHLWSRNLDISYHDHPGGVAWVAWSSEAIFGSSASAIRIVNAMLATSVVASGWWCARFAWGRRGGVLAAIMLSGMPPLVWAGRFLLPDALFMAALLPFLFFAGRLACTGRVAHGILTAVFLAILMNAKYNAYFLVASAVPLLVLAPAWFGVATERRRMFLIVTGSGAAVGVAPALLWNALHGWSSYRWQWSHLVHGIPLRDGGVVAEGSDFAAYATPVLVLAVLLLGAAWWTTRWTTRRGRGPTGWAGFRWGRWYLVACLGLAVPILIGGILGVNNMALALPPLGVLLGGIAASCTRWPRGRSRRATVAIVGVVVAVVAFQSVMLAAAAVRPGSGHALVGGTPADRYLYYASSSPLLAERLEQEGTVFAVEYWLAPQLRFYGVPAYTSWTQYRVWGYPEVDELLVVVGRGMGLPVSTETLAPFCTTVAETTWTGGSEDYALYRCEGFAGFSHDFLEAFDFLNLLAQKADAAED